MYAYQSVSHQTGGGMMSANQRHRETIDQYAGDGWRYAGGVPTHFTGHGGIGMVDLIFEREVPETKV